MFYIKFIIVSNYYFYISLKGEFDEEGFLFVKINDEMINGYFVIVNYFDIVFKLFFEYLKVVGVYDNFIIVMYGDYYGIFNICNFSLVELLGKDFEIWFEYDNVML